MPCAMGYAPSRVRVLVGSDGCRPKGMVGAIGGVDKGVLVSPRGCARGGATFCLPVLSPEGEGTFPGHSLRVCRGLYPVKGCAGGEAASRKHLELRRIVRDPEPLGW